MNNLADIGFGYRILDKDSLPAYLETIPEVTAVLGAGAELGIDEIGDGNLNFVFLVRNADDPARAVIVKQAVPYLRMVGEAWPLGRDRMTYEIRALELYNDLVPSLVPRIHHADESMSLLVMQYLGDHVILRSGMIEGIEYPRVAEHIGSFMAETLFATSAWSMDSAERRELMDRFTTNAELCKLTEDFIFTFPFMEHDSNYSNPATDAWARANIHADERYKLDVLEHKYLFLSRTDSLLHGDLHSGSMMVSPEETFVIDMEFAFFGPMSFDVGKVIANFLLCCTAHYVRPGGASYREWLLRQVAVIWNTFESRFVELWKEARGSAMLVEDSLSAGQLEHLQRSFMEEVLRQAVGFAACSITRRTVGIAGVADIRGIEDEDLRSRLEIVNLSLAKRLMADRHSVTSVDDLVAVARDHYSQVDVGRA